MLACCVVSKLWSGRDS